jgi:hypothetical protein
MARKAVHKTDHEAPGKRDRSDIGSPGSLSRRTTETVLASCISPRPTLARLELSLFPGLLPLSFPLGQFASIGPVPRFLCRTGPAFCVVPKYRTGPAFSTLAEFFASLVQRRPIADVFRAQPAGRFEVADGFRELLACLGRAILPEAENRKQSRTGRGSSSYRAPSRRVLG